LIHKLQNALAVAAALTLLIAPTQILAAPPLSYTTRLERTGPATLPGIYYFRGSLTLTVGSDGIAHGWYRQEDGGFVPVEGSLKDGHFWLDVGDNGALQIYAVREPNGTLDGTATNVGSSRNPVPSTFSFVAQPAAN
jgi:hypothetical protein